MHLDNADTRCHGRNAMGIENKRKAEQDGGPGAKMRRDGNGKLCPAAQAILDQKVADGSVRDLELCSVPDVRRAALPQHITSARRTLCI